MGHEEEILGTLNQMDGNNQVIGISSRCAGARVSLVSYPGLGSCGSASTPVAMPSAGIFHPRVPCLFASLAQNPIARSHQVPPTPEQLGSSTFCKTDFFLASTFSLPGVHGRYNTAGLHIAMADSPLLSSRRHPAPQACHSANLSCTGPCLTPSYELVTSRAASKLSCPAK